VVVSGAVERDAGEEEAARPVEEGDGALVEVLHSHQPEEEGLEEVIQSAEVHGHHVPGVQVVGVW